MSRGGHSRSGRASFTEEVRKLHGTPQRERHRSKGDSGQPMVDCAPPPGLSKRELGFWAYYSSALSAEGRLSLKARDCLAKYCVALAVVGALRRQLTSSKRRDIEQRSDTRKELRQWLSLSRLYENDLLLSPASSVRAPSQPPTTPEDPFEEFDAPTSVQ